MCAMGILPLSTILLLDIGTVPAVLYVSFFILPSNLSNLTHQKTKEMCRIVQDVGILRFYLSQQKCFRTINFCRMSKDVGRLMCPIVPLYYKPLWKYWFIERKKIVIYCTINFHKYIDVVCLLYLVTWNFVIQLH